MGTAFGAQREAWGWARGPEQCQHSGVWQYTSPTRIGPPTTPPPRHKGQLWGAGTIGGIATGRTEKIRCKVPHLHTSISPKLDKKKKRGSSNPPLRLLSPQGRSWFGPGRPQTTTPVPASLVHSPSNGGRQMRGPGGTPEKSHDVASVQRSSSRNANIHQGRPKAGAGGVCSQLVGGGVQLGIRPAGSWTWGDQKKCRKKSKL